MTVQLDEGRVRLIGAARIEDAEPLTAALRSTPSPVVDLSACSSLHGAVLQTLLIHRPRLEGLERNSELAELAPVLGWTPSGPSQT